MGVAKIVDVYWSAPTLPNSWILIKLQSQFSSEENIWLNNKPRPQATPSFSHMVTYSRCNTEKLHIILLLFPGLTQHYINSCTTLYINLFHLVRSRPVASKFYPSCTHFQCRSKICIIIICFCTASQKPGTCCVTCHCMLSYTKYSVLHCCLLHFYYQSCN